MRIGGIDLVIIVTYLAAIPVFGIYFRRFVKTEEDYFLAGKMLPWWVISMSIIGTNIGAYDYMGAAGGAYRFGIAQANYEWIGAIPAMLLAAMLFVPYYWRAGVYTVPEFLGKRFVQDEPGEESRQVTFMPGGESPVSWSEEVGLLVSGTAHELGTFNSQLWLVSLRGGDLVPLTANLDAHAGFVAVNDGEIYVEADYRSGSRLYRIQLRNGTSVGEPQVVTDDAFYYSDFSATEDGGHVAFLAQGPAAPPDIFVSTTRRFEARRLTEVNPQISEFALGEQRIVQWKSRADGEGIEGILTLPVGYNEGSRVPLLLVIHGGPSGVSSNRFTATRGAYPIQVFAGKGYAVLQPNYRGSTGYGERFRGLNRGDISGRDWIDIDSGVDELIRTGLADPDRLGIMGWSFGGHHTYWGITQTDRFAAASAGAGANDLISMYSQTDLPEFYHTYPGPKPWEDFQLYEERSAYRFVERVTTPLLIQVGERDERVPAEQSIQFFEAMRALGKAPTKLVVYPGQPHGVRQPRLVRDLIRRNVEWFTRWIEPSPGVSRRR